MFQTTNQFRNRFQKISKISPNRSGKWPRSWRTRCPVAGGLRDDRCVNTLENPHEVYLRMVHQDVCYVKFESITKWCSFLMNLFLDKSYPWQMRRSPLKYRQSQSAASCQLRAPASANAKTKLWPAFATSQRAARLAHVGTKNPMGVGHDLAWPSSNYFIPPRLLAGILVCRFIFLFIFHFYALVQRIGSLIRNEDSASLG